MRRAMVNIFYYPQSYFVQTLSLWRNQWRNRWLASGQFVRGQFVAAISLGSYLATYQAMASLVTCYI